MRSMRVLGALLIAGCFVAGPVLRGDTEAYGVQQEKQFEKEVKGSKVKLGYLLFLPRDYAKADKPWPMILFLHGAGESGSDLAKVKKHGPPKIVETKKDLAFIVVSPQSPQRGWNADALMALVDEVASQHKVDKDRIYVTGLSMGGFGTWALAAAYPDRFAAAVPICGGGKPDDAKRLKDLPIWAFHGAKDKTVPPERSEAMVKAIKAAGGNVKFTLYPEAGHDSWTKTYDNPELYKWLLEHRRTATKWSGTWKSEEPGHGGELQCVARQLDERNWKAHFTGYCNRQFAYEVEMKGRTDGDKVRFEGEADLGEKDGGVYKWTGAIAGDTFAGQYTSASGKKGEFRMTREKEP
jgi:dienelactone hydrolase